VVDGDGSEKHDEVNKLEHVSQASGEATSSGDQFSGTAASHRPLASVDVSMGHPLRAVGSNFIRRVLWPSNTVLAVALRSRRTTEQDHCGTLAHTLYALVSLQSISQGSFLYIYCFHSITIQGEACGCGTHIFCIIASVREQMSL